LIGMRTRGWTMGLWRQATRLASSWIPSSNAMGLQDCSCLTSMLSYPALSVFCGLEIVKQCRCVWNRDHVILLDFQVWYRWRGNVLEEILRPSLL
jgi:hypothetical protein